MTPPAPACRGQSRPWIHVEQDLLADLTRAADTGMPQSVEGSPVSKSSLLPASPVIDDAAEPLLPSPPLPMPRTRAWPRCGGAMNERPAVNF